VVSDQGNRLSTFGDSDRDSETDQATANDDNVGAQLVCLF
jgi:hypothetical protein